ncbi:hypothetical protein GCM10027053_02730 [Intrasporangium mesophilum]
MKLIQANGVRESFARVDQPDAAPVRVALLQHAWVDDPAALVETLRDGIRTAAEAGATIVFPFYGSSFISDPYGRILAQAPRDEAAVLVADLDLAQRQDWLELYPFLATRRPDSYAALTAPIRDEHRREAG